MADTTDTTTEPIDDKPQDHVDTPNDDINPEPDEGDDTPADAGEDYGAQIQALRDEVAQVKAMLDAMGIGQGEVAEPEEPADDRPRSYDDLFSDDDE
jgi:hypothetical protein